MQTENRKYIGYHASHEQFAPSELLGYVRLAEDYGFSAINSSDHFFPWSERQGQSGFSFAWLGAAMINCKLPFSMVCAPGQRYHPAIVAQAIATLQEMFPDRLTVALGSGEALNELITGDLWPIKQLRNQRLVECYEIIKKLLMGETIDHHGLVTVAQTKLYTLPKQPPLLIAAAVSEETAAWAGTWADGLITVARPHTELKKVVDSFRENGGADKPMYLKVQLAYEHNYDEALAGAYDQWRNNIFEPEALGNVQTVADFDQLGETVQPTDLLQKVRISENLDQHVEWINEDFELGFEKVFLHQVNKNQIQFIKDFGRSVLPRLNLRWNG